MSTCYVQHKNTNFPENHLPSVIVARRWPMAAGFLAITNSEEIVKPTEENGQEFSIPPGGV